MKEINKKKLNGFLKLLDNGFEESMDQYYIVTEMLGQDLNRLMYKCPEKKFTMQTAIKVAI